MMFAAEWGTGQVFWSMVWFFIFVIWIWMIIVLFSDIIRSEDLSGWGKATLGRSSSSSCRSSASSPYLIVRGGGMAERSAKAAQEANEATKAYIRDAAAVSSDADQLTKLADLHNSGKLDDAEYAAAKAKVIG